MTDTDNLLAQAEEWIFNRLDDPSSAEDGVLISDLTAEVRRLRAELDRARPVIDAAEDWANSTAFCRCENAEGAPLLDAVAAYDRETLP
jgi:hypothetical protein